MAAGTSRRTSAGAVLLVVLALPLLVAGAVPAGGAGTADDSVGAPAFLHVVTPASGDDRTAYLADPAGRRVLLRGVAAVGMQDVAYPGADGGPALFPVDPSAYDGRCPAAQARIPQPPLCEVQARQPAYRQSTAATSGDDFAQMRALGFDVVRLVLNWSQLEPTPGRYDPTYLRRVSQVVGWAEQQGIYVILDMHQDQYSRFIVPARRASAPSGCSPSGGGDGAPGWAVLSDGKPACALFGETDLNPAESASFYNFWHDAPVDAPQGEAPGTGLQDHYIGALATLANRFADDPAVLGYELMNEPQPGSVASLPVENLYESSSQDLYPFYRRAVEALTGVRDGLPTCPPGAPTSLAGRCAYPALAHADRQQIFFEPLAYRNLVDFSPQVSAPFSSYPNLVYAPHVYTHAFTLDQFVGYPAATSPYPPSYTFGYQTAESEAQAMHAAVFTTEFGDASDTDATVLSHELAAQDDTLTGGTLWAWKGLATSAGQCWCTRWQFSTYRTTANGTPGKGDPHAVPSARQRLIPSRGALLARVWPRATAGTLLAYAFAPARHSFDMLAQSASAVRRGDRGAETEVYVPGDVTGAVAVSGAALLDRVVAAPDGSRLAYVAPTGSAGGTGSDRLAGTYEVTVGRVTAAQRSAVDAAAQHPPAPISEAVARQTAEEAIATAGASKVAAIRSNAALARTLAGLLLGPTDPAAGVAGSSG